MFILILILNKKEIQEIKEILVDPILKEEENLINNEVSNKIENNKELISEMPAENIDEVNNDIQA